MRPNAGTLNEEVCEALRVAGDRIVITGAGGWLGLATLELLQGSLGNDELERRVFCFGSRARDLSLVDGTKIKQQPLQKIADLERRPTIVLHLAFLTKDRAEAMPEDEYCRANRAISNTVLHSLIPIGARSVFVASSGAAAVADDPTASAPMRLYGSLKREDEELFASWAGLQNARAVIARILISRART